MINMPEIRKAFKSGTSVVIALPKLEAGDYYAVENTSTGYVLRKVKVK
jgi:hypothetical protein